MKDTIMKKRVSIILPVYNEEKYIGKCIESIIDQTYPKGLMEILVIDGGSKDKTVKIIESYNIPSIKVLHNPRKLVTYALNIGIENASGDYIIRMDAHAEYAKNYIEKCIYYLINTDADNVGGIAETKGIGYIGEANSEVLSSKFGVGNSQFRTGNTDGYVDTVPFGAFRRELFTKIGMFNPQLPRSEDNDFNSRIRSNGGKVYLSSDIRFIYYCRNTIMGLLNQGIKNGNALFFTIRENRKAMSIRHYIPFIFVLSLVILPILSIWFTVPKYLIFLELITYSILDICFSFSKSKVKYAPYKLIIFPLFHISYGIGSLLGLFGISLL